MRNSDIEKLDEAISALLAGCQPELPKLSPQLDPLAAIAADLSFLPRPEFRARLSADLLQRAAMPPADRRAFDASLGIPGCPLFRQGVAHQSVLPPRFMTGAGAFPVRGSHLAISFTLHVAALAVVLTSGWWMVQNHALVRTQVANRFSKTVEYILPDSPDENHGGGGGGDHDKMQASRGTAARFSSQQLTPPTAVIPNQDPALAAPPTVIGPPDIVLPQSDQNGDPLAAILNPPSNGTGSGGGSGVGNGGGIGVGHGSGVGEGSGGGIGGGVYRVGGGVSAPRALYDPDPEYSEEARKAKYQGSVILWVIVGPDGRPRNLRVTRSLGMGLDEKALDAVSKWRFVPALKDGHPVAVQVSIEVAFRLY